MLSLLRKVAIAESVSYLVLLTCSVLKRAADFPQGVTVMGPVHGILTLLFLVLVLMNWGEQGWKFTRVGLLVILSVVPFGGFIAERRYLRDEDERASDTGTALAEG